MTDNKKILSFLSALEENNTLDWMHQNKKSYLDAKQEFEALIQTLIFQLTEFDPSLHNLSSKDLIFRLNRDTRFSKDKSPYNPAFRAHISSAGKLPIPTGYYIHVKPGSIFLGGGLFATQFPDATDAVRAYLSETSNEFFNIVENSSFSEHFTVMGTKLKHVPAGYDKLHPAAEYLKHKSWSIEYAISDEKFSDSDRFLKTAVKICRLMKPFNDYLNQALKDFQMPKRS